VADSVNARRLNHLTCGFTRSCHAIFVVSSRRSDPDAHQFGGPYETFGNTLQEAAASGLQVVAPAAGGPLDLVEDGVTGFLVAPGDAEALGRAVSMLAASPALRAGQGVAARVAVLGRTWPLRCDELAGHYEAALGVTPVEVPA